MNKELNDAARERVLEKIRKLLAVARDGRGNEHEAAAAASQAEKLMRHYQVEASDVVLEEIEKAEAFDRGLEDVSFEGLKDYKPKMVAGWVGIIGVGVGRAFTCKVDVVDTVQGVKLRFSGYAPDVMLARWVYKFLCETVFRLSREAGAGQGMAFAKAFRHAAASILQDRLYKMADERDRENAEHDGQAKLAHTPGTAVALYDRKKERVEEMFGEQEVEQKTSKNTSWAGKIAGAAAGSKINILTNRPLGAS